MTPTARSLKLLRDTGHIAGIVERWQVKRVEVRGEDLQDMVLESPRRRRRDRQPDLFDSRD